jgi:hypothetical protein
MTNYTLKHLINSVYENSKLTQDQISNISRIYKILKNDVHEFCTNNKLPEPQILQHGSRALNTIVNLPSEDIDLDIGITFDSKMLAKKNMNIVRKKMYIFFNGRYKHTTTEMNKCAITISFKGFHIDIVIYKETYWNQYVIWKGKWKLDKKNKQYNILKEVTQNNDDAKKLISFLKFIYKSGNISASAILPSIAITELIVQDFNEKFNEFKEEYKEEYKDEFIREIFIQREYENLNKKLLNLLNETIINLSNNFEILNSGSEENLIDNTKRSLDRDDTLNVLIDIYDGLFYYDCNNYASEKYKTIYDVFHSQNNIVFSNKQKYNSKIKWI